MLQKPKVCNIFVAKPMLQDFAKKKAWGKAKYCKLIENEPNVAKKWCCKLFENSAMLQTSK